MLTSGLNYQVAYTVHLVTGGIHDGNFPDGVLELILGLVIIVLHVIVRMKEQSGDTQIPDCLHSFITIKPVREGS